jgi:excisionase family DNA binding protein
MKELLTLREAAAFLKVGRSTLYRWCGEGKVPYLELHGHRRFRLEDLEGLLKRPPDQGGEGAS